MSKNLDLFKFMSIAVTSNLIIIGSALVIANQFFDVPLNF